MMPMRALRRSLLLISLLALAACNVVGKGNKLETLEIRDSILGRSIPSIITMTPCLRYNFEALATFTDGSVGIYTSRAVWSSSDTSVVRVSNGDIALPSDATQAYAVGTVIPVTSVAGRTATITVNYVGKTASFNVTIGAAPTIQIFPYSTTLPRDTSNPNPTLTIAPRTVQSYVALATINVSGVNRVTDVTSAAKWSVQNTVLVGTTPAGGATACTNTNTANLTCDPVEFITGSTSSFRAKRLNDTANPILPSGTVQKTVQADFNSIAGIGCPVLPVALKVANIDTTNPLSVTSEYGTNPPALISGTTDRLKVLANLVGGTTQDISELSVSGDGLTTVVGLGLPIQPATDEAPNGPNGLLKVVDPNNGNAATTFDAVNADGTAKTKTVTDCRSSDLSVFSYTLAALSNLIYAVPSADATVTSATRNFYASFVTVPLTTTTSQTAVTCSMNTVTPTLTVSPNTYDSATVLSPVFTRSWRSGTLVSISLCAVVGNTCVAVPPALKAPQFPQYSEDGARLQLRAIGTFTITGGTATQDITRGVTWTTSDSSTIGIINGGLSPTQAGQAVASQAGTVTIGASFTDPLTTVVTTSPSVTVTAN